MARPQVGALPPNPTTIGFGDAASPGAAGEGAALSGHRHGAPANPFANHDHSASGAQGGSALVPGTLKVPPRSGVYSDPATNEIVFVDGATLKVSDTGSSSKEFLPSDSTAPSTQAFGDAADAAVATYKAARIGHKHAMPANPVTAHLTAGHLTLPNDIFASLTTDVEDWAPSGFASAEVLRVDGDTEGSFGVGGLAGGSDGRRVLVVNVGVSSGFHFVHESAGSAAANRFWLPDGDDLEVPIYSGAMLWYDATDSRWRAVLISAKEALDAHNAAGDPHPNYRQEADNHTHASSGLQGGQVAHSALSGIAATDHHAAPAAGPDANVTVDAAGAAGTASTFARSGHGHQVATTAGPGANDAIDAAGAAGATGAVARAGHGHQVVTTAGPGGNVTVDAAGAAGATGAIARATHGHQVVTTDAPSGANVTVDAAATAAATGAVARAAHGHRINTYSSTPAATATAGAAGTSGDAPSRGTHVHAHGSFASGDLHQEYVTEAAHGGVSPTGHHAQAHAIGGADHTGTLDHGALGGLTDDDHARYADMFSQTSTPATPVANRPTLWYDTDEVAAAVTVPTGTISAFSVAAAPAGWLLCDGAAVSRAVYAALFALLGTTYGVGDGSTTFNVPNLKGRVIVGQDPGGAAAFDGLGETGGATTHTMTNNHTGTAVANPANESTHTHSIGAPSGANDGLDGVTDAFASTTHQHGGATGAGAAHTHTQGAVTQPTAHGVVAIVQPYMAIPYIIKT